MVKSSRAGGKNGKRGKSVALWKKKVVEALRVSPGKSRVYWPCFPMWIMKKSQMLINHIEPRIELEPRAFWWHTWAPRLLHLDLKSLSSLQPSSSITYPAHIDLTPTTTTAASTWRTVEKPRRWLSLQQMPAEHRQPLYSTYRTETLEMWR